MNKSTAELTAVLNLIPYLDNYLINSLKNDESGERTLASLEINLRECGRKGIV